MSLEINNSHYLFFVLNFVMECGLSRASRTDILWTNIISETWLQRPRDIKLQAVTSTLRQVDIYYVLSHLKILTFIQYIQQQVNFINM